MAKWKCGICGAEFDNFHAQGFDDKIYCPLCYFKKRTADLQVENHNLQQRIDKATGLLEKYIGVLDDTADLYFKNVLSILKIRK